jgi:hypothetical protein
VLIALPAAAHAEGWEWTRGDHQPRIRRARGGVAGEVAISTADGLGGDALLVSPLLGAFVAVDDHLELSLDVGLTGFRRGDPSRSDVRLGNGQLSAYYVKDGSRTELMVGGALTVPSATLPDGGDRGLARAAYAAAAASRGGWDLWLWFPEALAVVAPIHFGTARHRKLLLAVEGALAVPVRVQGGGAELIGQVAGQVGYRGEHGAVGVRLQSVQQWTGDGPLFAGDFLQLSMEPFFRVAFGKGFASGRLTINLDEPFGFAFDPDGVWAIHVGGGAVF